MATNFILRNADDKLWHQFKERAAKEGHTLRWVILTLIQRYIDKGIR